MANLRTANKKARRSMKRRVVEAGRAFHMSQVARMSASDTLHKLSDTRFARRQPKRVRTFPRFVPNLVNPFIRYV